MRCCAAQKEKGTAKRTQLQRQIARIDTQLRDEKARRQREKVDKDWKVGGGQGLPLASSQPRPPAGLAVAGCARARRRAGAVALRGCCRPGGDCALQTQEKAAVAAGKKPFFLKKSDKRKRELVAKYEELQVGARHHPLSTGQGRLAADARQLRRPTNSWAARAAWLAAAGVRHGCGDPPAVPCHCWPGHKHNAYGGWGGPWCGLPVAEVGSPGQVHGEAPQEERVQGPQIYARRCAVTGCVV